MKISDLLANRDPATPVAIGSQGARLETSDFENLEPPDSLYVDLVDEDALVALTKLVAADGVAASLHIGFAHAGANAQHNLVAPGESMWLLRTSGTTGEPKLVAHTLATLLHHSTTVSAGPPPRWGLLYPWSRFAGLQVVLHALNSRGTLLAPDLTRGLHEAIAFLAIEGCTHLSATPSLWRLLLAAPAASRLNLEQITLGGEIADQAILSALSSRYDNARITHVYASTDAGSAFAIHDQLAGFPASLLSSPRERRGIDVRDGELFIHNPNVAGLQGSPGNDAWIATGDLVVEAGGRFLFNGRRDSLINVGGSKFYAEQLEQYVLAIDGVLSAHVHGVPNPVLGTLVVVDAVATAGNVAEEVRQRILHECKTNLPRYMVPGRIRMKDNLHVESSGKLARR